MEKTRKIPDRYKHSSSMKKFFLSIPKTSVGIALSSTVTYVQAKGYIDGDTAVFLAGLLLAAGMGSNLAAYQMRK